MPPVSASLVAVLALVAVHLLASRLRLLDVIPRSRLLSMAGGMSVAYVFLRILPDLGRSQVVVGYRLEEALRIPRHPIYLVALLGLVVFYGLERLTDVSRRHHLEEEGEDCPSPLVFWVSMASYSIVNVLKEELPRERESRFWAFALGAAAYSALLLAVG